MSDPDQPRTPEWWTQPTPPTQPGEPGRDAGGFAPLDGSHPPTQPAPAPPIGFPPPAPPPPPPPVGYPPPYQAPYVPYVPYGYGAPTAPKTNGMAVASLVCGIVSIPGVLFCVILAVAAVPGLILGIMALGRIKRSNGMEQGRGLAIGGIATSAVGIVLLVLFLAFLGFAFTSPTSDF